MRSFNTEVVCNPQKHYMVDISDKVDRIIAKYVENGKYFSINRGRQYGKTSTLRAISRKLHEKYYCIQISLAWSNAIFKSDAQLVTSFIRRVSKSMRQIRMPEKVIQNWSRPLDIDDPFSELDVRITELCLNSDREVILMIDEADRASDNQKMLQLLELLRDKYIDREDGLDQTFKSVILAGVYDIKNLKLKLRPEEEHRYNSPWNVAAEFDEDLSFSTSDIAGMLRVYENDHQTGMDIRMISEIIYDYTSGYPVLVSAMCKRLDENVAGSSGFPNHTAAWTREGVVVAARMVETSNMALLEDMIKQLKDYPELKETLRSILFEGESVAFNTHNEVLNLARMFDYIKSVNGQVAVSNRIFEVVLYDYFLSEEKIDNVTKKDAELNKSQFIIDGRLDMEALLRRFAAHYTYVYADNDQSFVEKFARKIFLMYLKPVINGTGNYYIEAQTRDEKRTDIIVDYRGEQFLIEVKIWYGLKYNMDGEEQLCGYLDRLSLKKGYLLTFSFNKNKEVGVKEKKLGDKLLWEVTV
ncbi:MAG: ATP-binding protein [Lachnospiraceae bacterium]|nr:ATP-binding protein [Lachnospiraceae bacterium]